MNRCFSVIVKAFCVLVLIIFSFLVTFVLRNDAGYTPPEAMEIPIAGGGKIAVLRESGWKYSGGWPQTGYLAVLRETRSALDYLGYEYDLVDEKTPEEELNAYDFLISIAGTCSEKIVGYTRATGKTALVLYELSPGLCAELGIIRGMYIPPGTDKIRFATENDITRGAHHDVNSIAFWGAYSHLYPSAFTILLESTAGHPVLLEQTNEKESYIFLLTRAETWNANNYKLLDNIIRGKAKITRVGGTPYAMDVPVIIRLEDFGGGLSYWQAYTNISKKFTVAAVMQDTAAAEMAEIARNGTEIWPHGYRHEDLSEMQAGQQKEVVEMMARRYQLLKGHAPAGLITPFNHLDFDTVKTCAETGMGWVTTYSGLAQMPRHYYQEQPNEVWILGTRPENSLADTASVEKALGDGLTELKPLMFVEHPNKYIREGRAEEFHAVLIKVIAMVAEREGFYLTGLDDYFQSLTALKSVRIQNSELLVENTVRSGLTLDCPILEEGGMIKVGADVLMYYRQGKTVLPSLGPGSYPLSVVREMPRLCGIGPGIIVRSAVYHPEQRTAAIELEAFVDKETLLTLENLPAGKYRLEVITPDNGVTGHELAVFKDGTLKFPLLLRGDQKIVIFIKNTLSE